MGFGKDGKGVILSQFTSAALSTLALNTGIFVGTKPALLERFRILKTELDCTLTGLTALEGGGLSLYLCDGDLSLTECEEAIEATGPLGPNDDVVADTAMRSVLIVGALHDSIDSALTAAMMHDMNSNSPVMVVKPRWTYARTKSWNWMVYNKGTALTTGATARIHARHYGVWVGI